MGKWILDHLSEINYFVAGWCAAASLSSFISGDYVLALINAVLIIVNIRLANR